VAPGASTVAIDVPPSPACSADDTSRAVLAGDHVSAPLVRCARWIAAAPGEPGQPAGTLRVATCEADACGSLVSWRAREPEAWSIAPPAGATGARWPVWATWTLAGVGAAVAAGVAIVASGALQSAPTETRFVSGGLKSQ
jgi:hypothetical protein